MTFSFTFEPEPSHLGKDAPCEHCGRELRFTTDRLIGFLIEICDGCGRQRQVPSTRRQVEVIKPTPFFRGRIRRDTQEKLLGVLPCSPKEAIDVHDVARLAGVDEDAAYGALRKLQIAHEVSVVELPAKALSGRRYVLGYWRAA